MKRLLISLSFVCCMFFFYLQAMAAYPDKPVTIIVPFAAGGETDLIARMLANGLTDEFKQNVLVQNVVGAAGVTGMNAAKDARANGYTLAVTPCAPLAMHPHMRKVPYTLESFKYIGRLMESPYIIIVKNDSDWQDFNAMISDMKANPGKYYWGSTGVGSVPYFALMDLFRNFDVQVTHVPFSGDADALQDLAGNRIQVYVSTAGVLETFQVKPMALMAPERLQALPAIPSIQEFGKPIYYSQWMVLMAPKKTPDAVVKAISQAMENVCTSNTFQTNLAKLKLVPGYLNPTATEAFVRSESEKNLQLIKEMMSKERLY